MSDNTERLEAEIRVLQTRFDSIVSKLDQHGDSWLSPLVKSKYTGLILVGVGLFSVSGWIVALWG